jgi:hypothetical protein
MFYPKATIFTPQKSQHLEVSKKERKKERKKDMLMSSTWTWDLHLCIDAEQSNERIDEWMSEWIDYIDAHEMIRFSPTVKKKKRRRIKGKGKREEKLFSGDVNRAIWKLVVVGGGEMHVGSVGRGHSASR